ncbi:pyridoxamine 5'-phosphate oxidase family protein [Adhaeretor mobilis]|uniref:Pyridoxamine 5'-phosphate oxidase n=1 Tax=Adhaeretor mobilis TaxID=1930276 RepID=A0A517N0H6_9BACT|nr:pyridoxamine 5'-phosphate oxidase family protein [Adhaeretor mobilis]QDT00640.1 Pyridoxamine 5'-phosphate oxidase [Adhaeretor mobilis]
MGKIFETIDEQLQAFIESQQIFFVATAPLSDAGHVNLSPRGLDSLRVLGPQTVAFVDMTGSGVETIAHLKENGRITLMFCAFSGPPKILRLQGIGEAITLDDARFEEVQQDLPVLPGVRAIIHIQLDRISDSCGYGVPQYEYLGDRTQLTDYTERKGPVGIVEYQRKKNRVSIDGLPGLDV